MSQGYGTDLWCADEVRTGQLVSGAELVAQALYRRLTTPRGTLIDGADGEVYGTDVSDFVGQVGADAAVDAIPDVVLAEVLKDDRVDTATVDASITRDAAGQATLSVEIEGTLRDSDDTFALTLAISDVATVLVGVSAS